MGMEREKSTEKDGEICDAPKLGSAFFVICVAMLPSLHVYQRYSMDDGSTSHCCKSDTHSVVTVLQI